MNKKKIIRSKPKKKKLSVEKTIQMLSELSIDQNEKSVINAIEGFEKLLRKPNISKNDRENVILNLANSYKHRGVHQKALETLDKITVSSLQINKSLSIIIKQQYAISYAALGYLDKACDMFAEAIEEIQDIEVNSLMLGGLYLEAGNAYHQNDQPETAERYWREACSVFEKNGQEIQHLARVKANLGFALLNNNDEEKQKEGINLIEKSSELKRISGDIEGLANNYCNLGIFYSKRKNYERAIAYTRKDLFLSRKVGDLRAIGSSLGNLAGIYTELKQLSPARDCC